MPKLREWVRVCVDHDPKDPSHPPIDEAGTLVDRAKIRAEQMNGKRRRAQVTRVIDSVVVDLAVYGRVNVAEAGLEPKYENHLAGGITEANKANTPAEAKQHGRWWTEDEDAAWFPKVEE